MRYNPYLKDFRAVDSSEEGLHQEGEEYMWEGEEVQRMDMIVPEQERLQENLNLSPEQVSSALSSLSKWKDIGKVANIFSVDTLGNLPFFGDIFGKKERSEEHTTRVQEPSEGMFESIKKKLHLEHVESGDILLVVIVIYLMLEGDDTLELAITLGILGFMWYNESKKREEEEIDDSL